MFEKKFIISFDDKKEGIVICFYFKIFGSIMFDREVLLYVFFINLKYIGLNGLLRFV